MKLAIVGTHTIEESHENYKRMREAVLLTVEPDKITEIVSGGAKGIDTLAEILAMEYHIPVTIYPAEWKKFGRAAGPKQNTDIVNRCDVMVAFPDIESVGTKDSMKKARLQKKLKMVWWWDNIDELLSGSLV